MRRQGRETNKIWAGESGSRNSEPIGHESNRSRVKQPLSIFKDTIYSVEPNKKECTIGFMQSIWHDRVGNQKLVSALQRPRRGVHFVGLLGLC